MSIAAKIKELTNGATAYTLYGGYALKKERTVRFPGGRLLMEKRNDTGRMTRARYAYADGSMLEFSYSESRGAILKAIEPKQE